MQRLDQSNQSAVSAQGDRLWMNKSVGTNLIALLVTILGYCSPYYPEIFKSVGLFALSGAITNWLAIHMLFEKVPGLYGSGIIPSRFEEFKAGIRNMMMNEFFTRDNLERFLKDEGGQVERAIDLNPIIEKLDYHSLYLKLVLAIKDSPLGGMLALVGGEEALKPLQGPFEQKMREALVEFGDKPQLQAALKSMAAQHFNADTIIKKVEGIVNQRLDDLSPRMVKDIIQDMIRAHLGWLVVWGGIFGGILGFTACFL